MTYYAPGAKTGEDGDFDMKSLRSKKSGKSRKSKNQK